MLYFRKFIDTKILLEILIPCWILLHCIVRSINLIVMISIPRVLKIYKTYASTNAKILPHFTSVKPAANPARPVLKDAYYNR